MKKPKRSIAELKQAVELGQPLTGREKQRLANHLLSAGGYLFDGQPRETPVGQQRLDAEVFHHSQGSLRGVPSQSLSPPVQAIVHEWQQTHPDYDPDAEPLTKG